MSKIIINNSNYYYELHGKGDPLVLISGYGCDHFFWTPILDNLKKQFQVLIVDNRGIGQTRDLKEPISISSMADDMVALTQALNLKNPHFVGHSMGGAIVQSIGSRYNKEIGKLGILLSSAKIRQATLLGTQSILEMRKSGMSFDSIFNAMLAWVYGEKFLQGKKNIQLLKSYYLENLYPQSIEDQERQFQALRKFDGREDLKSIQSHTLIVHGTQDLIVLPYETEYMAAHIPNAKLVKLDCAHGLIAELPEEISKLLIDFFQ